MSKTNKDILSHKTINRTAIFFCLSEVRSQEQRQLSPDLPLPTSYSLSGKTLGCSRPADRCTISNMSRVYTGASSVGHAWSELLTQEVTASPIAGSSRCGATPLSTPPEWLSSSPYAEGEPVHFLDCIGDLILTLLTKDKFQIHGFMVRLNNDAPSGGRWLHNI